MQQALVRRASQVLVRKSVEIGTERLDRVEAKMSMADTFLVRIHALREQARSLRLVVYKKIVRMRLRPLSAATVFLTKRLA